jgi:hypothetical protein
MSQLSYCRNSKQILQSNMESVLGVAIAFSIIALWIISTTLGLSIHLQQTSLLHIRLHRK